MDLRPAEVTSILEKEIANYEGDSSMQSVGTVLTVGDGVARVWGLDACMMNELLEFAGGIRGVALNLEEDNVGCVLLGDAAQVKEGDPRRIMLDEVEGWKPDCVFVGATSRGKLERFLLGSVSATLVEHAACSVEVSRAI